MGVYAIQAVLWAIRDTPISVTVEGKLNEEGVDYATNGKLIFKNGKIGNISTYSLGELDNLWTIRGTKGSLTVSSCGLH